MPAKREQVALQEEVSNQEQWDDLMGKENVIVVDVYQKWCGPCMAVVSLFRKMKNELGDDLLKFANAECDSIEALEQYRGRCEPCFLFFAGGQLVDVVRGARGPILAKAITDQLAAEHKVQEEGAERKVIKDPMLAAMEAKTQETADAEAEEKRKAEEEARKPIPKEVTVVLIKPDAVKEGKVEEIKQKIEETGCEILAEEEKTLTEEEAREFYKEQEGEDHFEALIQFMSSGPSHIMVLTKGDTGEGVIHEVRALIGPKDVDVAKEEAPQTLRALYGTDKTMNALHGADSGERAARELSFFFPEFVAPTVPGRGPAPKVEKTLALIRPDALKEHKDSILEKVKEAGFEVCLQKEVQLTEEQAKEFYKEQEGTPHFEDLIREMTAGPVLALGLAREEAVQGWRNMLGPKEVDVAKTEAPDSLRAQFSLPDSTINALHGSDSPDTAQKELNYFFPVQHTLAVIKPDAAAEHKDVIIERIKEAGFNIACQKEIELPRDLAHQLYKEHEGKEFHENLVDYMSSGPSMVMVLSREDAITGWRTIMGPTDPEVAKEQAPESLRALLGKDILQNAIHGSSTEEHAKEKIEALFPEVEIKEDGQLIIKGAEQDQEDEAQAGEEEKTGEQGTDEAAEREEDDQEAPKDGDDEDNESGSQDGNEEGKEMETDKDESKEDNEQDADSDEANKDKEEEQTDGDNGGGSEEDNKEEASSPRDENNEPEDKTAEGDEANKPDGEAEENPEESTADEKQDDKPAEGEVTAEESKPEGEDDAKPEGDEAKTDGEETKPEEGEAKAEGEEKNEEGETAPAAEGGGEKKDDPPAE